MDSGFGNDTSVDVVIRPEDVDITEPNDTKITGVVKSVTFKGVHYEMVVEAYDHDWLIHSTKAAEIGRNVGLSFGPDDIHIMRKREVRP